MSKVKTEKFTCQRDGLTIRGLAYLPEGTGLPAAIISHGFMATYHTTKNYAAWFAQRGYASFCFDFNGGGIGCKSDKDTAKMSVLTEKEDLKAVMEYVRTREETDASDLTLMGCSQGGFVSAMAAAQWKEQVRKLILFYPAFCIPDDARAGRMMMAKFDPRNIPDTFRCGPMKLGKCYPEAVLDMQFEQMIRPYGGPVLIVHGDRDKIVDIRYAKKAAEVYADAKLKIIPGAGHGFSKKADAQALEYVDEFLKS